MFSVCVVVVIHGHEYVRCFGNPAHPRIHLYKKDALTHFDALIPAPGSGDDAAPASASAIVDVASSSDHYSVSFTSSPMPIVIEETSSDDNDVPLVLPPHPYPTRRSVSSTARMQTGQVSSKRPNQGSSSSSSSTSEDEQVPYTTVYHHTPPCTMLTAVFFQMDQGSSSSSSSTSEDEQVPYTTVYHHTPPCTMLTAVFFQMAPPKPHLLAVGTRVQMAPPNPHLLAVGTRVSPNLSQSPKEELVRLMRTNGHNAIQRNIRHGFIYMICKDCDARCSVSTYKNDAWCVLKRHDAVGRMCKKSQKSKSQKQNAGKVTKATRAGMLLLGGVWWCTVPRLKNIMYVTQVGGNVKNPKSQSPRNKMRERSRKQQGRVCCC
jgi:hypothetical protein